MNFQKKERKIYYKRRKLFKNYKKINLQKIKFEPVTLGVQTLVNVRDLKLRNFDVEKTVKKIFARQIASMIVGELPLRKTPADNPTYEKWTSTLTYVPKNNQAKIVYNYSDKIDILFMLERLVSDPSDIDANIQVREFIEKVKRGEIDIV